MRLTLNFIFGGLGAGIIVAAYLLSLAGGISKGDLILPDLTGGAIIALGLACVWVPGGIRLRSTSLLRRPKGSWTAWETYSAIGFFIALAVFAKLSGPVIEFCVAATAALFLFCQAHVPHASKSRPAWRAPQIPSMIAIAGLAAGTGLIALLTAIAPAIIRGGTLAPIAGMVLAAMGAYRWREYADGYRGKPSDAAVQDEIQRTTPAIYIAVHALPFALYLAALIPWAGMLWMLPVAGVVAIAAGAVWTNIVIARLGHARDFTASPVGL